MPTNPTHPSYKEGNIQDGPQEQPSEVFCEKGVLKNFVKFIGKHLCQSLIFNKTAGPDLGTGVFL